MRQIFWLPPKQNPEVVMRQMLQSGGTAGGTSPTVIPGGGVNIDPGGVNINPGGGGRPPSGGGGKGRK
jgi:hypothetical protein